MPILSTVNSIEVEKSIIYHNELKVDVVFSWSQPHVAKNMKNLCILFFFPPSSVLSSRQPLSKETC